MKRSPLLLLLVVWIAFSGVAAADDWPFALSKISVNSRFGNGEKPCGSKHTLSQVSFPRSFERKSKGFGIALSKMPL